MHRTKIIAEIGVNHNGSIALAKKLIDKAKILGADFVKFQIFDPDELAHTQSKKADYQSRELGFKLSQHAMLKKLMLTYDNHVKLFNYAKTKNIKYLASGFSIKDFLLIKKLGCEYIKVPSGEITNFQLLSFLSRLNKKIIISSGASDLNDIKNALHLMKKNGQKLKNVVLMHCTSAYPAPLDEINLNVLDTFKEKFKTEIGYSDHTDDVITSSIAVAKGARIIEKHFTLDNKLKGPDHKASLNPIEFKKMVKAVRDSETILGDEEKKVNVAEKKNLIYVRKSLVAKKKINKGEKFNEKNLTVKRPGDGICASNYLNYLNKIAKKNYKINEKI